MKQTFDFFETCPKIPTAMVKDWRLAGDESEERFFLHPRPLKHLFCTSSFHLKLSKEYGTKDRRDSFRIGRWAKDAWGDETMGNWRK